MVWYTYLHIHGLIPRQFDQTTFENKAWISNYIPHETTDVNTYPSTVQRCSHQKGPDTESCDVYSMSAWTVR